MAHALTLRGRPDDRIVFVPASKRFHPVTWSLVMHSKYVVIESKIATIKFASFNSYEFEPSFSRDTDIVSSFQFVSFYEVSILHIPIIVNWKSEFTNNWEYFISIVHASKEYFISIVHASKKYFISIVRASKEYFISIVHALMLPIDARARSGVVA